MNKSEDDKDNEDNTSEINEEPKLKTGWKVILSIGAAIGVAIGAGFWFIRRRH